MRIRRIDLAAIGRFTDAAIDFGPADRKIHLIYGSNEAGKSTLLRTIWAFFYGDLRKSPDAYEHATANLRIGMTLESAAGEVVNWTRRAGGVQSLRGDDDQPVAAERLQHLLGNLSEAAFRSQFAINHSELSLGSRQLYAQKGELGASLFAVASGLTSVSMVASELAKDADEIFSPGGRKKPFNETTKRFESLKKSLRDAAVSTAKYNEVVTMRDATAQRAHALLAEKAACQDRERLLQRVLAGIPKVVRLAELKVELATLPAAPALGPNFGQRRESAIKARERLKGQIQFQDDQLAKLREALSECSPSDAAIELLPLLTPLTEAYGEYAKAQLDRSRLEVELKQCQREETEARRSLAGGHESAQIPSRRDLQQLRRRLAEYQAKFAKFESLQRETSSLEAQLAVHEKEFSGVDHDADLRPFKSAMESALRRAAIDQEIDKLSIELAKLEQSTQSTLKSLAIELAPEAFLAKELPQLAAIADFERRLGRADGQVDESKKVIQELTKSTEDASLRLAALLAEAEVPSEQDVALARAKRNRLWKEIREERNLPPTQSSKTPLLSKIDNNLAETFETALHEADRLADLLRSEARRIAERAELQKELAIGLGKRQSEELKLTKLRDERDAIAVQWCEFAKSAPTRLRSPSELKEWQPSAIRLQDQVRKFFSVKSELTQLRDLESSLCDAIRRCGAAIGLTFTGRTLAEVLPGAQEELEEIEGERSRRAAAKAQRAAQASRLAESQSELSAVHTQQDALWLEMQAWIAKWDWSAIERAADLEHLLGVMEELERLDADKRDKLLRISGIDRDATVFEQRLRSTARKLVIHVDDVPAHELSTAVTSQLRRIEKQRDQRLSIQKQITEIGAAQEKHGQELRLAESDLKALMLEAGADSIEVLGVIEEQARFRRLTEEEQFRLERELTDLCDGQRREAFLADCEATDLPSARQEIELLKSKARELDEQIELERREVRNHEAWLQDNQMLEKVAIDEQALQESRTELAALVREHVKSRLAAEVLNRAMRRYRDDNQGDLLNSGGELFSRLTGGVYSGIRAEVNELQVAELFAERQAPPHIPLTQLSDGARDQLYLALRIATLQKHFQSHQPMPFIVDDIFVMFDDNRTLAALKELATLAESTQVIIFTHHSQVVELALGGLGDRCVTHELTQTGPFRTSAQIHEAHTAAPIPMPNSTNLTGGPARKRGRKSLSGD